MQSVASASGLSRGWMELRRRARSSALGFSVSCAGESWQPLARRISAVLAEVRGATNIEALARATLSLVPNLQARKPGAKIHQEARNRELTPLRSSAAYSRILEAVGPVNADAVTTLF